MSHGLLLFGWPGAPIILKLIVSELMRELNWAVPCPSGHASGHAFDMRSTCGRHAVDMR